MLRAKFRVYFHAVKRAPRSFFPATIFAAVFALGALAAPAPEIVTEEVPIGFLPMDWVNVTLKKTLSPQARTVFVHAGPVRITDTREKVDAARRALEELQKAPAFVSMELSFATTARRTVQRLPVEQPIVDRGIPYPTRFDPPRIIQGPNGVTVIPSQPREFTTRNVGPGTAVNPTGLGYITSDSEVRLNETTTVGGVTRRFTASSVPGKPVALAVQAQAADPAALRALALKLGSIVDAEPAWPAARTELLLKPDLSGSGMLVTITPQIIVPPARRIPLPASAAAVLIARGAPSNTGLLPRTDPEFYRVFLGTPRAEDDTYTALTIKAQVKYVGSPPQ